MKERPPGWGDRQGLRTLKGLDRAIRHAGGVRIGAEAWFGLRGEEYPAGASFLSVLLPDQSSEGGGLGEAETEASSRAAMRDFAALETSS